MYSADRMKTLIRFLKDYDKNIVFRDCQMHFLNIYLRRKEIFLIIFCHLVEHPANYQSLLDYCTVHLYILVQRQGKFD